ncbi:MAG TPA: hypothetical protein VHT25_12815 [Solirubrobacteraceae bacterium]|jgi:hypothetical protein|nr:hypothetical protein [Solirubrobacteraceae bacterium]
MLLAAVTLVACLSAVTLTSRSQAFTLTASLTPDVLGAPTNLSTSMTLSEGADLRNPISHVVAYGPAGLQLDPRGLATCERTQLEAEGPLGCPAESRVGFGGGVGAVELGNTVVKEPYTLDFFLAPSEHGHLRILIYADASHPISVDLVMTAREVVGPRPYGFGLAVEVPPISAIPGAANAWVESSYFSLGASNVAYYRTVHGDRKLVHVEGLIAPARCPSGGFPFETILTFEDHTTSTGRYVSPCPRTHR